MKQWVLSAGLHEVHLGQDRATDPRRMHSSWNRERSGHIFQLWGSGEMKKEASRWQGSYMQRRFRIAGLMVERVRCPGPENNL